MMWLKTYQHTCAICGKEFIAKRRAAMYCSQTCINKASWERMKNNPERLKKHREYNKEYIKQHKK